MNRSFTDQCGNQITLNTLPSRIISLVPSQTELLADLGLDNEVVGITKYCVHPTQWTGNKALVGGTKNPDIEAIRKLRPDLIIGNKEENDRTSIELLQENFNVWMSDIDNLNGALSMIESLGKLTGRSGKGLEISNEISHRMSGITPALPQKVLYLIWRKPWMAAASNTFIDSMLQLVGLLNVLSGVSRYPELTTDEIILLDPALVFLSSEPYPFKGKHVAELAAMLPRAKIMLVDGEMFSWYGSRLLKAPAYFNSLPLSRS